MTRIILMRIVTLMLAAVMCNVLVVSRAQRAFGSEVRDAAFPGSFANLADKVKPAVVNIRTTSIVTAPENPLSEFFGQGGQGPFGEFFHHGFGNTPNQKYKQQALGSGFIIDKSGYILTNNHVIDNAQDIAVRVADGREFKAKIVGRDEKTDLALIKVTSKVDDLPTLSLGNSDRMRVGDWVIAVGNPFGLGQTVTQGIISATGRVIGAGPYDDFLQTDAPINPGNSGGPLVNMRGEVIGINTAIVSGGQGIGFAIPSNIAKAVMQQLRTKGKVVRGWIGVGIQTLTPDMAKSFGLKEARGALVSEVVPGGPADKAGVHQGDIIMSFAGKKVKTANDLPFMVAETPVGKTVDIVVYRNGKEVPLNIRVEEQTQQRASSEKGTPAQTYGMKLEDLTPELSRQLGISDKSGVVVVGVEQGSLAEQAGIQAGDVIREANRKQVRNLKDFRAAVSVMKKGQALLLLVKRGKQAFYVILETE